MHGHLPQQHPGLHPAGHHQPPPHLTHLANLPPHSIPRDHHANRLNSGPRHHQQPAGGMAPHLPMQVPPPPHQQQNPRKPPGPPAYYATNGGGMHGGGLPKPLPLTAAHMHPPPPPPPGMTVGQPTQQQQPQIVVGGKLPYGMGATAMGQHGKPQPPMPQVVQSVQQQHTVTMAPPPSVQASIPVVSAATPAGTKTRHIPSSTDHKTHHHNQHATMQSNGSGSAINSSNSGPGSKGGMIHHQTINHGGPAMDKSKSMAAGNSRHHHQQAPPKSSTDSTVPPKDASIGGSSSTPSAVAVVAAVSSQAESTATSSGGSGAVTATTTAATGADGSNGGAGTATAQPTTVSSSNSLENLANIKEKTTMCLVNELARYNKIQHQYRLTDESGPAHKKRFTVTLKLGDEEYTAEGASIKKAQHKAAGDAIAETKYKHPPARTKPRAKTGPRGNVSSFTPTVELNALAMKRGEPTVYQVKAVPLPATKYPLAPANGLAAAGRRSGGVGGEKLPPPSHPAHPGGLGGVGYGAGGRYVHPNGVDWGRGSGGAPGGMAGVAAGAGGRGAMGGFHPTHQQQHQQPPAAHHHAHHPRAGGPDDGNHHHNHLQHHHHPHHAHHHGHQQLHHHHSAYHHHDGPAGYGHPSAMPVQEFYKATLRVGERTFLGEGHSPQAARHDAAARALEVLKPLTAEAAAAATAAADGKGKAAGGVDGDANGTGDDGSGASDPNAELKSPISLVHEMAVQRNVSVVFEVISEKGPPHMTVFVTQCKVGTIVTEGEGTGKKPSKKRAAEKMLEELRKLQKAEQQYAGGWGGTEGTGAGAGEKRQKGGAHSKAGSTAVAASLAGAPLEAITAKKKTRNLIKEKPLTGDGATEKENPISRLMQIQQARKEKQPVYAVVENERPNVGRRRQFTIEVSAAGKRSTGVGMTKKAAKWNAAEALLLELGYVTAPASKSSVANGTANKENQSGAANEAPTTNGLGSRKGALGDGVDNVSKMSNARTTLGGANHASHHTKADTSKDAMNDSTASNDSMVTNSSGVSSASSAAPSGTAAAPTVASSSPSAPSNPDIGRNKEQLLYLAQLLKFEVQFSDFPKGNHGQYLTLVVLSTEPPQVCHGSGASLQESQDEAARCALEMLSQIGLDNVKPKPSSNSSAGDGGLATGTPSAPAATTDGAAGK